MRPRPNPRLMRNKLDLSDRVQVRLLRKRLCLSDAELAKIVDRVGNSISGINKEVAKTSRVPASASPPPAAVIVSATVTETAATELTADKPTTS